MADATQPLLSDPDSIHWPEGPDPDPRIQALCRREDIQAMSFFRFARLLFYHDAVRHATFEIAIAKYQALEKPGFWDRAAMSGVLDQMLLRYPELRPLAPKKRR